MYTHFLIQMILARFWERLINVRVASRIVTDFFLRTSPITLSLSLSLSLLILTPFCLHPTLWKGHGALTASQSPLTGSRWLESCNQNGTTILFMVIYQTFSLLCTKQKLQKDWLITLPAFVKFFQFYTANNPQGILGTPFQDVPTVYN